MFSKRKAYDKEMRKEINGLFQMFDHRAFHYWVNEDKIYGDYIVPNRDYTTANSSDLVVNGTFDLINFFPVALDLEKFKAAWGNRVSYEIKPEWGSTNSFNFCLADIPWNVAGSVQTTNTTTLAGQLCPQHLLSRCRLTALNFLTRSSASSRRIRG